MTPPLSSSIPVALRPDRRSRPRQAESFHFTCMVEGRVAKYTVHEGDEITAQLGTDGRYWVTINNARRPATSLAPYDLNCLALRMIVPIEA
jgi:hypothetical protein